MNLDQLAELAASGENETLEFKTTTGTRREAAMTLCAFLNQDGGTVLFGVAPTGEIRGQHIGDSTFEDLSAEFQRIDPPAFPRIERVRVDDARDVIVVSTDQGASGPYRYRGIAYRRVGNTTLAMSAEEYNRMLLERTHSQERWEILPAEGWTIDDLDVDEIRRTVLEANHLGRLVPPAGNDPSDLLRGLGLLKDGMLLRAAAVLYGRREPLMCDMPQCLLRVARFRGTDKTQFLDNRQFEGNAFTLLASAECFLRDAVPISSRFEPDSFKRIDEPRYPPLATREALANAICHRDYATPGESIGLAVFDDRLEVTSPGPLRFGLTPEELLVPHESKPWNPLIARSFYRRGIIERWGSGTLRMVDEMRSFGLRPPEFEDDGQTVTVRFWPGKAAPESESLEKSVPSKKRVLPFSWPVQNVRIKKTKAAEEPVRF